MSKLTNFAETINENHNHAAHMLGLKLNPHLNYFAINVQTLETCKPEDWEQELQEKTPDDYSYIVSIMNTCYKLSESLGVPMAKLDADKVFTAMLGEIQTLKEALPPQPGATGGAAPNPMQMLTEMYGMMKQVMDLLQQDASADKGETGQGTSSQAGGANG